MLKKNVYILYPAGYGGSYINWAISISDADLCQSTIKTPVNQTSSKEFGASGTSHLHVRVPTHQDVHFHLAWIAYNRPTENKIYIINTTGPTMLYDTVRYIMQYDPTGVFISIHNNNDLIVDAYGTINCVTKWPTFCEARAVLLSLDRKETFDWFGSGLAYRNFIVNNNATFFMHNTKLDLDRLQSTVNVAADWYKIRNKLQPHEINETGYVTDYSITQRVFELSTVDICSSNFPIWLENFMKDSDVSDQFNCDYVSQYHSPYMQSQPNLQWFDSFAHWEQTGELDQYLTSHSVIEAQIILAIFKNSHRYFINNQQRDSWISFYSRVGGKSWPMPIPSEHDFYTLPPKIQKEIIKKGYVLNVLGPPNPEILHLDWENMNTPEINKIYQRSKLLHHETNKSQ